MANESKDTIYIDVDEEITGIISKVQNSSKDIVALVLPKRASVLQSIVNMRLLKRAQEQNKKKIVLITSESRILPLAGAAGLFVASNLTSKPYIPPIPKPGEKAQSAQQIETGEGGVDPNTPVSQVAPDAKFADSDEIEIDNTPKTPEPGEAGAKSPKPKKDKKSKVPNFSKFRRKIILIALAVLLLIFAIVYGLFIAPKAKVTVNAQTSQLPLNVDFIADTKADSFDSEAKVVRATTVDTQKNDSESVDASGQKNNGKTASGSVSMSAQKCSPPFDPPKSIPAGTGVSYNGITYITQSTTTFSSLGTGSGSCITYEASDSTEIEAQSPGKNANVNNVSFSVSGRSDVSATGSASGGTDKIVKVVSAEDVSKAKERLNGKPNTVHDDFVSKLKQDGYIPIEDTFKAEKGSYDVSPSINSEGDKVTVSVTTSYSMLGVKKDDLVELIKNEVNDQSEGQGQTVLSDGLDDATLKVGGGIGLNEGQLTVNMDTTAIVGPNIDQDSVKQQIAGKKTKEAEDILGNISGISDPKVELSPFWVGKVPKNHSKITIEVHQSDGSNIP
ncbi:MAG TPA: hypothetical protein VFK11_03690 [Candidatus Saccharimonadales bacterium]|nr:hypothetical protein [Candidatus Saccharimonadales bacterium]